MSKKYTIPLVKMDEVYKRIQKANNRLKKAGNTELFTIEEKHENIAHDNKFVQVVHVTLNTPVITAGNHEFLASVDILPGGTVLRSLSNIDTTDLPRPTDHTCEYCGTKRARKNSYLLRDKTTGKISHIGKTCLEVFTGVKPALWTLDISLNDFTITPSEYNEHSVHLYDVREIVHIASILTENGEKYISQSKSLDYGVPTTASKVEQVINGDKSLANYGFDGSILSTETLDEILESVYNIEGDYGKNLQVIVDSEKITSKHFNLAVSIVSAYYNHYRREQRVLEKKRNKDNLAQEMLRIRIEFPEKMRLKDIPVTITHHSTYERTSYNGFDVEIAVFIIFSDDNGNSFVWHSNTDNAFNLKKGDQVLLTATVKKHKENDFNHKAQVFINRARTKAIE